MRLGDWPHRRKATTMAVKKCVICDESTANTIVVHETCHDQQLDEQAQSCFECERSWNEMDIDQLVAELREIYLPNCRVA